MRHRISGNRIGRNSSLRKATLRDLAKATLVHQKICTTKAKAKEARKLVDKLITLGKKDTLAAKRRAFAILCDHGLVSDLFNNIAGRFKSRLGGYTRIIPLSERRGDRAFLVYLELTEKKIEEPKKPAVKEKAKAADKIAVQPAQEAPAAKPEIKKAPEARKEKPAKEHKATPPPKEIPGKEKQQPKNMMGGIKRLFTKKPPSQ